MCVILVPEFLFSGLTFYEKLFCKDIIPDLMDGE